MHARRREYFTQRVLIARFEIMIAEHRDNRQVHRFLQCSCESFGLLEPAVVGQVTAQDHDVRAVRGGGQHRRIGLGPVPAEMQVGERDQPDRLGGTVSSVSAVNSTSLSGKSSKSRAQRLRRLGPDTPRCRGTSIATNSDVVRTPVQFYREVLAALADSDIPFLIGGAFAFCRHAGIDLRTKDLDLMIEQRTWPALARVLRDRGIYATLKFPHWLGKALSPDGQVDIIFNSGAGVSPVDASWFAHSVRATVLGHRVRLCGVEEMIWSKAFVMERERFDGADVLHLIRARADDMDWERLGIISRPRAGASRPSHSLQVRLSVGASSHSSVAHT